MGDAESNAESDAKRRKRIEAKNDIDSLIYSTEKSLLDNGDKLEEDIKKDIEKAIAEAKEVKDGEDLEIISTKKEALSQASMKIGEAIYKAQQTEVKEDGAAAGDANADAQDAEFTEKKTGGDEKEDGEDKKKDSEEEKDKK